MSLAFEASCANHAARTAVGLCVHCQRSFCADCITKVDGINHCSVCYEQRAEASRRHDAAWAPDSGRARLFALTTALFLAVWGLLELGFHRGGLL